MMMGIGQMMMEVEGRVFLLNIQPRLVIIVTSWRLWLGSLYGIVVLIPTSRGLRGCADGGARQLGDRQTGFGSVLT